MTPGRPNTASEGAAARTRRGLGDRLFRSGMRPDEVRLTHDNVLTAANGLTVLRLAGIPVAAYCLLGKRAWLAAAAVLGVMAVLDIVDGYVARRFDQQSRVGTWLDPVVDRATVVVISLALVVAGTIPLVMAALILLRDVLLFVLVAALRRMGRPLPVTGMPVARAGKVATAALLFGLPGLLLRSADFPGAAVGYLLATGLTWAGIILYYVALLQYARAGRTGDASRHRRAPRTERRREDSATA